MKHGSARISFVLAAFAAIGMGVPAHASDPYANAPAYARPLSPNTVVTPLITTGQQVQKTGAAPGTTFRFPGIPDGIGVSISGPNQLRMFVNAEYGNSVGGPAGPLPSGSRITELTLGYGPGAAVVTSARDGIQNVYSGEPASLVTPTATSPRFTRFCSGYLGGPWSGLDTEIYFAGEETSGAGTFDGLGGSAVALVNGDLFQLPRMGHAAWENIIVLPGTGAATALLGAEDAGALTSQLYLYLGSKVPGDPDALTRNGLRNGNLYVLAFDDPLNKNEATFLTKGATTPVHWAQVNFAQNDAGLEAQSQSVGSFNFTRVEDLTYSKTRPGVAYFVTTGSPGTANPFGRLYRLDFNPADPAGAATLTLLLDGTEGVVSPDNIDINAMGKLMICEDPNYNLGLAPLSLTRDTYLWSYDVSTQVLTPILEMDRPAAIAHALAADPLNTNVAASNVPGGWEFSGITDASALLGPDSWFLDVQAHSLRINPTSSTVEGGQVLTLTQSFATPTLGGVELFGDVTPEGRVRLTWAFSGSRNDLFGFQVERSDRGGDGEWTALTRDMLSAVADRFEDTPGDGDWYYRVVTYAVGRTTTSDAFHARVGDMDGDGVMFAPPSPNPAKGGQTMRFRLPARIEGTPVDLSIFDASGRKLRTLFNGAASLDEQTIVWDGFDDAGRPVRGLVFSRLHTADGSRVQRILRTR